jgi:hypothetical protein
MVSSPASWILAKNRDPDQASYPVKLLGLWLREQEIPCLDLWAPIAGGREDPAIYFFRTDSHPNARGYETMAQLLGEWVLNEGLIPEK